ncbi:hypothetical protein BJ508DRAFT_81596 [Ascobolus immersus RN42]|uniref:Uncharacterized protein n=1 Tax=Ascobolus immersus RN42 TaxID=1160509 RepID=A0A3N4IBV5_ASCIM|nr:hypothetical protein BJ508DRAFT_81596 [Ascobolus immersus RN42]
MEFIRRGNDWEAKRQRSFSAPDSTMLWKVQRACAIEGFVCVRNCSGGITGGVMGGAGLFQRRCNDVVALFAKLHHVGSLRVLVLLLFAEDWLWPRSWGSQPARFGMCVEWAAPLPCASTQTDWRQLISDPTKITEAPLACHHRDGLTPSGSDRWNCAVCSDTGPG